MCRGWPMVSLIAYTIGAIYSYFLFGYGLLNASGYFSPSHFCYTITIMLT